MNSEIINFSGGTMLSGNLPSELLVDILSRLPAKALVRFISVCKSWYALIKSPSFVKTHLNRSLCDNRYLISMCANYPRTKMCSLVCGKTLVLLENLELPLPCDSARCTMVGSVHGLLCLVYAFGGREIQYLCNPSIRKYKAIGFSCSMLPFFAKISYAVLGFGYHHSTDDYKVIRLLYTENSDAGKVVPEVEVYRLSTDSWRTAGYGFPWKTLDQSLAAFVNGNLHWMVSAHDRGIDEVILSFDMSEEVFLEIMLPDYQVSELHLYGSVCVLKESLSLFAYCPGSERCYLWVMKEYGVTESWNKQFTIVTEKRVNWPLGITRFDEIILETSKMQMVLYDLENRQTKNLRFYGRPYRFHIVPFIESLLLLDEENGMSGRQSSYHGTSQEETSTSSREEEDSETKQI